VNVVAQRVESSRGRWTYSEWCPPALSAWVDRIWHSEGTTTEDRDRHFPHGMIELLVNVGGDRFDLLEPTGTARFTTTWLCGQLLGPTVCTQPRRHAVLGIRLHPAGAYALLGTPLGEITGLVVELEDVLGAGASDLVDRCRDAMSVGARFHIAAAWLAARLASARPVDPAVAWAAARIAEHAGDVSIARLRAETGFSKARLAAAFRDQIGVTPKRYARLVRFRHALGLIERGAGSLADVALASGYYDQPHFNADFRELTGLSPRELLVAYYPSGVPIRFAD
jgi:AraC-like DNA-binding protein